MRFSVFDQIAFLLDLQEMDCSFSKLPEITFIIGKTRYSLQPEDYLVFFDDNTCALGIRPINASTPNCTLFILGTLFLKKYYTVFDSEAAQIGLALLKKNL